MTNRYRVVRSETGSLLVIDTREDPYRHVCVCSGWNKYEHAYLICDALNDFSAPIEKIMNDAVKGSKRNVE